LLDADNGRNNEVVMKNLLTIAFIVSFLCACGGEISQHNKAAVRAPTTKQTTMEYAAVEKESAEDKQVAEADKATAEPASTNSKSGSAIRMMQGLARSMY
jgi:hypothetical protein